MAVKYSMLISCALGALIAAPSLAQGGAQPTQGTAPSGANNSTEAGTPASAEGVAQVPAATPGQDNSAIQEIVVTANKREENLQRVAGTVTAVSQAALTRQGVKDITDISKVVPEVRIQPGALTNIGIRGVRTGAFGPTTDSPNAVHIDGVYLSRFSGLNGFFFDVQRVEVLAGPQGTLYGRNSAGGTINIISNKPTMDDVHAQGSLEYGNYNQFTVNAAINVPLSDTLAVRGAYYHFSHRGYSNNGLDDADLNSGRVSLLWKPSSSDSLLITADQELLGGKGGAGSFNAGATVTQVLKNPTIYRTSTGGVTLSAPGTFDMTGRPNDSVAGTGVIVPIIPSSGKRDARALSGNNDANNQDIRSHGYMGQYDHDLGFATLTAQAAYRKNYLNTSSGSSGFFQDPRLLTTGVIRPSGPGFASGHSTWNTQEIRLASPSNHELTYTLGLYRFHERSTDNHSGAYNVVYPNTGPNTIGQVITPEPLTVNSDIANVLLVDNSYAAFGQAVYSPGFLPGLHLTGGLRYNYEKKHGIGDSVLNSVDCGDAARTNCYDSRASYKKLTYKANIAYDITSRNTVYFDNSTGFKSGGFSYGPRAQYLPENITSFEIGSKNRFFNNKLQLNLSAWHYNYKNIVTTIGTLFVNPQLPPPGITFTITGANGRRAKIDGQSASIIAQVTPDDSLSFNGTHLNARYTDFDIHTVYQVPVAPGVLAYLSPGANNAVYDYSHTPIALSPNWAFSATYDHIFHVFGGELDAQGAVQYASKRLSGNQTARADVLDYAAVQMPGYTLFDASLRYAPTGGRWAITAYGRNVTNKAQQTFSSLSSNLGAGSNFLPIANPAVTYAFTTKSYGPPRTYGVILSFNY